MGGFHEYVDEYKNYKIICAMLDNVGIPYTECDDYRLVIQVTGQMELVYQFAVDPEQKLIVQMVQLPVEVSENTAMETVMALHMVNRRLFFGHFDFVAPQNEVFFRFESGYDNDDLITQDTAIQMLKVAMDAMKQYGPLLQDVANGVLTQEQLQIKLQGGKE